MREITLNADEVEALSDFLFCALIPYIQNKENEVDNPRWIHIMTGIWMKCEDAGRRTDEQTD